jgi:hypothetical protein
MPLQQPPPPPALIDQASTVKRPKARITLRDAVWDLFNAYDLGEPLPPEPALPAKERAAYRWLRAAATAPAGKAPADPFPARSASHKEAESLRGFLALPTAEALRRLPTLPLQEPGSQLALWRWGQALTRRGEFTRIQRRTFEDRLLEGPGVDLLQGYALRHALCFALAEKDEARLADLRAKVPEGQEPIFKGFQSAFGLLGGFMPPTRLWLLPGGEAQDLSLGREGAPVWIAPPGEGDLPPLPPGTTWVIPSLSGGQDSAEPRLVVPLAAEAQPLATRLGAARRTALFAASRTPFERLGLVYFPILMRFDGQGRVLDIRMGDAAPTEPGLP